MRDLRDIIWLGNRKGAFLRQTHKKTRGARTKGRVANAIIKRQQYSVILLCVVRYS
ncbi:MAG: hypothetical protein ACJA1Z_001490 [Patiriisocius sp.]|jgi:hypothetical protein